MGGLILSKRMHPRIEPVTFASTEHHSYVLGPEPVLERLQFRRDVKLIGCLVHEQKPNLEDLITHTAKEQTARCHECRCTWPIELYQL